MSYRETGKHSTGFYSIVILYFFYSEQSKHAYPERMETNTRKKKRWFFVGPPPRAILRTHTAVVGMSVHTCHQGRI